MSHLWLILLNFLGLCEPVYSSKLVAFLINVHHISINSALYPVIVNTLRLPKFSVPLVFTDKCHCVYYFSHTYHEPRPLHEIHLLTVITSGEKWNPWRSSLCNFLHSLISFFLLRLHILLSTLFSNSLNICFSYNARDHVPRPYKMTGKILGF